MTPLTQEERRALEWIRDNHQRTSQWLVNGRKVRNEPFEKWTHMEIRGNSGSICIPAATVKRILPYVTGSLAEGRIFDLTEEGRAALSSMEDGRAA
jgi:hypothetical protein